MFQSSSIGVFSSSSFFFLLNATVVLHSRSAKLMNTDNSMVVSAPTGAGKTVLFDLAIIRALKKQVSNPNELGIRKVGVVKMIYLSPLKVSCFINLFTS